MDKTIPELFATLKAAEVEIKKEHQVLMVNKTTSFKKKGKGKKGNFKKNSKPVDAQVKKPKSGPKPKTECFYYKGTGHWKRNCPKYLAKKKDGKVKEVCGFGQAVRHSTGPAVDAATQLDQLDSATAYIKQLKGRIDHLKRRKQAVFSGGTAGCSSSVSAGDYKAQTAALPVIEVRHQDGTLDVALASEAGRPFRLHQVIAVLEQEGAEVLSASFSVVGDKIFYTLHSQALCPRIGLEAGRAAHRLRGLAAAAAVSSSVLLT
ncbi:hypothetical protein TRIUR3_01158 [Triticum urartu]|uniref:CCHC-type domain-containing protein n=1 Tax=Triticum urartu TaxID=4572 RepID=M7YJW5_TRIUA|nr:hypothetical protein TRIUR3_01158 [Triticum urartu]